MYTIKSLKKQDPSFDYDHTVSMFDVKKVNKFVKVIEATRNDNEPTDGDIVRIEGKNGKVYNFAHIQKPDWHDMALTVCTNAYVPFVSERALTDKFYTNASGGYWQSFTKKELKKFKLVGKQEKTFCVWGHCGATAGGAIDFKATVNVWKLKDKRFY